MRTEANPADRQQPLVYHNAPTSTQQINLPQKRKAPDSSDAQTSEDQLHTSPPAKPTLRLKVPSPGPVRLLAVESASSSTSSGTVPAATLVSPIRLRMTTSVNLQTSHDTAPASSEGLVAPITQATMALTSTMQPLVLTEDVARAEQALVSMNPLALESSEPVLKRRKTEEKSGYLEAQPRGIDTKVQKEAEYFSAANFIEAINNFNSERVESCIFSGFLKLETLDLKYRTKALLMMISRGDCEAVRALLKSGVDTKVLRSGEGLVHLKRTISKGDWRMIRELFHGSPGNGCEFHYVLLNLLHQALRKGDCQRAKVLLKAGISPDKTSKEGNTALSIICKSVVAASNSSVPMRPPLDLKYVYLIKALINAGAYINQPIDQSGDTLLHKAYAWGYSVYVPWLLAMGANPEARNSKQQTPSDLASPNPGTLAMSSPTIPSVSAPVNPAQYGQQSVALAPGIGAMVVQPAQMTAQREFGQLADHTQLLFAMAAAGQKDVMNALATVPDLGINAQNEEGLTPLMTALLNGHQEVAHGLLSMNANPYVVKPGTRVSAFTIAAMKGLTEVLCRLIERPEFAALKDITGVDALCAAVEHQQIEAVIQLRRAGVSEWASGPTNKSAMMAYMQTPAATRNMPLLNALIQ